MTGYLTTHVLDTAIGQPAAGMQIELFRISGTTHTHLVTMRSNADGRTDAPILPAESFAPGTYELIFHVGAYLDATRDDADQRFLDIVPIRFSMDEASHYHVPLLLSPFGYSTYRGS